MYQDILAHILNTNGFPAGSAELTRESAAGVQIIPKGGSPGLPASAFAAVVGCLAPGTGNNTWKLTNGSRPVRALAKIKPDPANMPLGDREFPLIYLFIPVKQYVGHRMLATGSLVGPGGEKGLEVSDITSLGAPLSLSDTSAVHIRQAADEVPAAGSVPHQRHAAATAEPARATDEHVGAGAGADE
jgi:hypothetical protein